MGFVKRDKTARYIDTVGDASPLKVISGEVLITVIGELNVLLRREHSEDYCGIVYTGSLKKTEFH